MFLLAEEEEEESNLCLVAVEKPSRQLTGGVFRVIPPGVVLLAAN